MREEVLSVLGPELDRVVIDATFGRGGLSEALLDRGFRRVIGIDRDPSAVESACALERRYGGRFRFHLGRFSCLGDILVTEGLHEVDGIVFDLGVASTQLDDASRGFSFRHDGPLDMRMSQEGLSAQDLVNGTPALELERIIRRYGEERHAKSISRAIASRRAKRPFTSTRDLASTIAALARGPSQRIHPATRTFQALRIAVNDEMNELECALDAAAIALKPKGKLVVISFHSLEDRRVKAFMRAGEARNARDPITHQRRDCATLNLPFRKAKRPSAEEISRNPRARSARLRLAIRTANPPVPFFQPKKPLSS